MDANILFTAQVASPAPLPPPISLPPPTSLPPQIGNLTNLSGATTTSIGSAPITAVQDAIPGGASSVAANPEATTASSSSSSTAPAPNAAAAKLELSEYGRRLALIYEVYNPINVPKVDYLLQKYTGREELLYFSVCAKYSVPDAWDGSQPLNQQADKAILPEASESPLDEGIGIPAPSAPPEVGTPARSVPPKANEPAKAKTEETIQQLQRELNSQAKAAVLEEDDYDPDDPSGHAAALAALQQLTGDLNDESMEEPTPEKLVAPPAKKVVVLRPPPEVPSAKGMAFIDRLLVGEKTDFFSDEEDAERIAVKEEIEEVESDGEDAKLRHEEQQALLRLQQQEKQRKKEERTQQQELEVEQEQKAQQQDEERQQTDPDEQKAASEPQQVQSQHAGGQKHEENTEVIEETESQPERTTDPYQSLQTEQDPAADSQQHLQQQPTQEEQLSLVQPPPTQHEQQSHTQQSNHAHQSEHERQQQEQPDSHDSTSASEKQPAPAAAADGPSDVDQQRLAAAAAAAKGVLSHAPSGSGSDSEESSSGSGSDSEESSAGSPKSKGMVQTTAGPGLLNGGARKASPFAGRGESTQSRAADRESLLSAIFQDLERFCGTEGRATVKGMQRFVTMVGFDGSDNEWRTEYLSLSKEWQMEPEQGFDLATFSKMVNDKSQRGCYCSNDELRNILAKLTAAPRVAAIVSRKRRDPASTSESVVPPSQKKPKA